MVLSTSTHFLLPASAHQVVDTLHTQLLVSNTIRFQWENDRLNRTAKETDPAGNSV